MNPSVTEGKSASGSVVASSANTRLSGSWLIVARVVWLALVIPSVGLFVVSLIVTYQQMQTVCVDPATCNLSGALPPQVQHSLSAIGLSVSEFAILVTIFFVITAVVWYVVGFLIFWRRSDDWLALLAAFFLVLFSITSSGNTANALAFALRWSRKRCSRRMFRCGCVALNRHGSRICTCCGAVRRKSDTSSIISLFSP